MKRYFSRLQDLILGGYDLRGQGPLFEMKLIYINFTIFMAAISSPVIGILHLGHWFSYSSYVHGVNCMLFAVFHIFLIRYARRSTEHFIVSRNLLLISLFMIFASNLVFSDSESMRLLWFAILLIVAQGLGGARVRNIAAGATFILFAVYLSQPFAAVNLTATDIISSILLLLLVVTLFDFYDLTIQKAVKEIEAARSEALHMAGVKSRFLSSMSHEIRTPLNGIVGFTEMLLRDESEQEKIERLSYIRSSGNMLSRLIGNVLDLSKIDDGKMTIERRCYELRHELEAIGIFRVTAHEKGVEFSINVAPDIPGALIGDSLRLTQVLGNLINNAIRFTEKGGRVVLNIDISPDGKLLNFEVIDNGVGIPEEKQAFVFSPFTQLDESIVRQYGGTGLGLSISSRLVELMGGELYLESQVGKGSRFFFSLPLNECRKEVLLEDDAAALPDVKHGRSILVVEDDRINQVLMRDFIERMGHEVTVVSNGHEAVNAYMEGHYDLVLMDISMPVMDGVEATKKLRELGATIPVIALTANIFKEDVELYLASGMTHCLSKPVDMMQLEKLIHTFFDVSE